MERTCSTLDLPQLQVIKSSVASGNGAPSWAPTQCQMPGLAPRNDALTGIYFVSDLQTESTFAHSNKETCPRSQDLVAKGSQGLRFDLTSFKTYLNPISAIFLAHGWPQGHQVEGQEVNKTSG